MIISVNLSMLFTELPFLERFGAAAAAGFSAVEFWWPSGIDDSLLRDAVRASGVQVALFNFNSGNMAAGERGLLSDPDRQEEFRAHVPVALDLAEAFGCRLINAQVGLRRAESLRGDQLDLAATNIRWAADLATEHDVQILIEPLNRFDNGPYLLTKVDETMDFIRMVDRPNVRLQFDIYHTQRTEGDLVATARRHIDYVAHVQVADSPDRHEPGTGEINYRYVISELGKLGYRGYLGLEFKPRESTQESLRWVSDDQRSGEISPHRLFANEGLEGRGD